MGDSESLSMMVRSGLYRLPILELLAPNDVVPGDKEHFGVGIRTRETKLETHITLQLVYIDMLSFRIHFDVKQFTHA